MTGAEVITLERILRGESKLLLVHTTIPQTTDAHSKAGYLLAR